MKYIIFGGNFIELYIYISLYVCDVHIETHQHICKHVIQGYIFVYNKYEAELSSKYIICITNALNTLSFGIRNGNNSFKGLITHRKFQV